MDPQGGGGGHHGFQQWQWSGGQGGFPFGEGFNPFGDDGGQYSFKFNFGWKLERLNLYIYFFVSSQNIYYFSSILIETGPNINPRKSKLDQILLKKLDQGFVSRQSFDFVI